MNSDTNQTRPDLLFVRHAESKLNEASHEFRVKHNLPYIWQLLCQNKEFLDTVKYNHDLIDCPITKTGVKQCKEAKIVFDTVTPDVILVSPLERTLMTCNLLFKGRNIPVIVEPLLAEAFRSACDLSFEIAGKKQRFPQYNFENVQGLGDLWFVKNDSQQNQAKYNEMLSKLDANSTHRQKLDAILSFMADTFIFEVPLNVRNRCWKIKQLLQKYKQKYNTIAIVAHYNTINYTVARQFSQKNEPANSANVTNCEIFMDRLDQIIKYK